MTLTPHKSPNWPRNYMNITPEQIGKIAVEIHHASARAISNGTSRGMEGYSLTIGQAEEIIRGTLSESQPPAEMATVDAIAEKWATLIYRRTQLWASEKGEATSCVKEAIIEATALEKSRRTYYQDIVYGLLTGIDKLVGRSVQKGTGLLSGTIEQPSDDWKIGIAELRSIRPEAMKKAAAICMAFTNGLDCEKCDSCTAHRNDANAILADIETAAESDASLDYKNLFNAYQSQCVIARDWEKKARQLGYVDSKMPEKVTQPPAEVRPVGSEKRCISMGDHNLTSRNYIAKDEQPPTPPVDVDAFMSIVERAWESGYIHGHNDEMDGCFDKDTNFQAKTNARNFKQCVTEATAALSAALELARKENGELRKDKERLDWLRGKNTVEIINVIMDNGDGRTLRQAIDEALDAAKGKGV